MDSNYHFLPKFIRNRTDFKQYQEKISQLDLKPGITAKIFTFQSFSYCRICFDGRLTNFYIDGDLDFFYGHEHTYVLTTYRIINAFYEKWKRSNNDDLHILFEQE
jgi:hypothetical protein